MLYIRSIWRCFVWEKRCFWGLFGWCCRRGEGDDGFLWADKML